jgi:hypothetical protein
MEDPRCCGTGTCIINAEGYCWCGQQWDGEKMCFPKLEVTPVTVEDAPRPGVRARQILDAGGSDRDEMNVL